MLDVRVQKERRLHSSTPVEGLACLSHFELSLKVYVQSSLREKLSIHATQVKGRYTTVQEVLVHFNKRIMASTLLLRANEKLM